MHSLSAPAPASSVLAHPSLSPPCPIPVRRWRPGRGSGSDMDDRPKNRVQPPIFVSTLIENTALTSHENRLAVPIFRRTHLHHGLLDHGLHPRAAVAVACDQNIQDVAVLVHRPPKIMTLAADGDEHFVHMPDVAEPTLSSPRSTSIRCSKLPAPGSNGFVGNGDATLSEKVLDIAKTQSEPMVQPDGMADDLGWRAVASIP